MQRIDKQNNRPSGRAYGSKRPSPSGPPPKPTRASEPASRSRRAGAGAPDSAESTPFFASLLEHLKSLTTLQTAILCAVTFVCAAVVVTLSLLPQAGSGTALLGARGTAAATPSPQATAPSTPTPAPSFTVSDTPSATPTPAAAPSSTVIHVGTTDPSVAKIQMRLMDLGFMEEDEPTQYFGTATSSAISLFQRQSKLSVDGSVGAETYALLMSADAPNYTVMLGDSGADVKSMQERLHDLGYLDQVTGKFGDSTVKAVKAFQQSNGLGSDGKVGQKTLQLIFSDNAKANFLKYGAQSGTVIPYQKRLKALGYLMTTPDGTYGANTVAAVKRFQNVNGLIADGYLGPNTVKLLLSAKAIANSLVLGMQGSDVQSVQTRLKALGYLKSVTGYFGADTANAVKAFQKRNGLSSDGRVGQQTLSKLNSSSAKKAAAGSKPSGGSGSSGNSGGSSSSGGAGGVETFISIAQSKLGDKYVSGGKGPSTFDCSGFVYYCLNNAGVKQSYLTAEGWAACGSYQKITSIGSLQRGDILVFKGSGHVGIYLGNGCMIDASSANGKVVKRSGMWDIDYWKGVFICGFRVF